MPDETTTATTGEAGEPQAGAQQQGQAQTTEAKPAGDPLGEAGKEALRKEREAREAAEKELKRLQREQARRDEDEARAKGEFEKLAGDRQKRIDELEAELAQRDRAALRAKVAAAHKLPADLADLLRGEDEAALTESAKLLAKHVQPRSAPDTEAGAGSRGAAGPSDRPLPKKPAGGEKTAGYTFDGRPKVAFPAR